MKKILDQSFFFFSCKSYSMLYFNIAVVLYLPPIARLTDAYRTCKREHCWIYGNWEAKHGNSNSQSAHLACSVQASENSNKASPLWFLLYFLFLSNVTELLYNFYMFIIHLIYNRNACLKINERHSN